MKLTRQDVDQFLADRSGEMRRALLLRAVSHYNGASGVTLSAEDKQLIEAMFRNLAKKAKPAMRKLLVDGVKDTPYLPQDIALMLASDASKNALPILKYSPALSEGDLLKIIKGTKKMDCLMAIAQRSNLPESVTAALFAKKDDALSNTVLNSFGSKISEASYREILSHPKVSKKVLKSMLEKGSLSFEITGKLFSHITGKAWESLNKEYEVVFERKDMQTEIQKKKSVAAANLVSLSKSDNN